MDKVKVYTKTGDCGTTGLIGGTRVPKYHLRLEAYGTVDELNSYIGVITTYDIDPDAIKVLMLIQNKLFQIGALLATDKSKVDVDSMISLSDQDVLLLESEMDEMNKSLDRLDSFVLPGGHPVNGFCHLARTVCRRAERRVTQLSEEVDISPVLLKYLNRLSDYLFLLSRKVLKDLEIDEIICKSEL